MTQFKRQSAIRILAAELKETTIKMPKTSDDQYEAQMYTLPSGVNASRVLLAGTAVEKEDVGKDEPFWRLRVADPSGAFYLYAGQYQPEAAQVIQSLQIPCFITVIGKLSIYSPDENTVITSIKPETITIINGDERNSLLADITAQTINRMILSKGAVSPYPEQVRDTIKKSVIAAIAILSGESTDSPAVQTPEVVPPVKPEEPAKPETSVKAAVKEDKKPAAKKKTDKKQEPDALNDAEKYILDIITEIREGTNPVNIGAIKTVCISKGCAVLDVDKAVTGLKMKGYVIEEKAGWIKPV